MRFEFEISPSDRLDINAIPDWWPLTITCRGHGLERSLALYRRLGGAATPHVTAASLQSEAHLQEVAATVSGKVFLIGGDPEPAGPFSRAAQLIPYFGHCAEIGVAGYPEGHPSYPYEAFGDDILLEKQELGATYVVSQICFDPQAIVEWVRRTRERGVTLPIYCGVPAPISVPKLLRFAQRSGVTRSLRFLGRMSRWDVARMATRYDPRPVIDAVADEVDGFHIYTFNAVETTRRWLEDSRVAAALAYS